MPMPFNPAVMTNGGIALLTKAQAGECSIEFTRMVIGDGTYSADEETVAALQARTSLKSLKNSYAMSGVSIYTDNSVKLTAILSNQDPVTLEPLVTEGYYINEIGVYGKEKDAGDDTEVLYSIATTTGTEGDYMPPYNGSNPAEITQDYYCTVANSTDVTVDITGAALTVEQANEMKEEVDERLDSHDTEISDLDDIAATVYNGRDLTEVFADEIAGYSDEWAWIKARINAANFSGLRNGDYIPLTVNGERHEMQINIDTYYRTTDSALGHHIDFISRDCMSTDVQWNTENNNNGNADEAAPYMVSNLHDWLINTVYPMLPDSVKNVITTKRALLEKRYSSSGTLTDSTDWAWYDMGELWVPSEYEVFGSQVWSTKGFAAGQAMQYPIFANSYKNRVKGNGPNGGRYGWWLASVRSGNATSVCSVTSNGAAGHGLVSGEYRVPLCFRIKAN